MAHKAFVVNHGHMPYKEKWGDGVISLMPGERLEMDHGEAVRFLGTFSAPVLDGNGDTISGKTLHLEGDESAWLDNQAQSFISQIDGQDYGSEAGLKAHYAQYKHLQMVKDVAEEIKSSTQTTGSKSKVFACHICDFETSDKRGLVGHMRSHDAKPMSD